MLHKHTDTHNHTTSRVQQQKKKTHVKPAGCGALRLMRFTTNEKRTRTPGLPLRPIAQKQGSRAHRLEITHTGAH